MGRNRDRMAKLSAMPPDLLAGDMADELEAKIDGIQKTIQTMQDQIYALDRKLSDCCPDDAVKLSAAEIAGLRKLLTPTG